MTWWMVLGGTILTGLAFGAGSITPRRRQYVANLQRAYDDGYDDAVDEVSSEHAEMWQAVCDQAAREWEPEPTDLIALHARYHQAPAPLYPPGGAGQMSPGPDGAGVTFPPVTTAACPADLVVPVKADSPGPGGDPLFAALDDDGAFALIRWELRRLAWMASEPFALTAWQAT